MWARVRPSENMPEDPIRTIGLVREQRGTQPQTFTVELPNGKIVIGHLPRRLTDLADSLVADSRVLLEMTPYDFEKARIAGLASETEAATHE